MMGLIDTLDSRSTFPFPLLAMRTRPSFAPHTRTLRHDQAHQEITMKKLIAVAFGLACLVAAPSLASAQYSFGVPTQSGGAYEPPPPPYYGR
jgi:hypothetical protein